MLSVKLLSDTHCGGGVGIEPLHKVKMLAKWNADDAIDESVEFPLGEVFDGARYGLAGDFFVNCRWAVVRLGDQCSMQLELTGTE